MGWSHRLWLYLFSVCAAAQETTAPGTARTTGSGDTRGADFLGATTSAPASAHKVDDAGADEAADENTQREAPPRRSRVAKPKHQQQPLTVDAGGVEGSHAADHSEGTSSNAKANSMPVLASARGAAATVTRDENVIPAPPAPRTQISAGSAASSSTTSTPQGQPPATPGNSDDPHKLQTKRDVPDVEAHDDHHVESNFKNPPPVVLLQEASSSSTSSGGTSSTSSSSIAASGAFLTSAPPPQGSSGSPAAAGTVSHTREISQEKGQQLLVQAGTTTKAPEDAAGAGGGGVEQAAREVVSVQTKDGTVVELHQNDQGRTGVLLSPSKTQTAGSVSVTVDGGSHTNSNANGSTKSTTSLEVVQTSTSFFLRMVLERIGLVINIACQLAPMNRMRQVKQEQTVGSLSPTPFTLSWSCNSLWLLYAIFIFEPILILSNISGACLNGFYVYTFAKHCQKDLEKRVVFHQQLQIVVFLFLLGLITGFFFTTESLGSLASAVLMVLMCAPVLHFPNVYFTKDVGPLGAPEMAIAGFLSCCIWSVVGFFFYHKAAVWLPHIIGGIVAIGSCVFFATIGKAKVKRRWRKWVRDGGGSSGKNQYKARVEHAVDSQGDLGGTAGDNFTYPEDSVGGRWGGARGTNYRAGNKVGVEAPGGGDETSTTHKGGPQERYYRTESGNQVIVSRGRSRDPKQLHGVSREPRSSLTSSVGSWESGDSQVSLGGRV